MFLYLMGEICNIYIYVTFLFNGLCKFKAALDGQKEIEYEKILVEPSRAATILP